MVMLNSKWLNRMWDKDFWFYKNTGSPSYARPFGAVPGE